MTLVAATVLPTDQRFAAVRSTDARSGLEITLDEIATVALDLGRWDVVDDFEDVPNAPNDGQLDRNHDHEDEKEVHGRDFTG